MTSPPPQSSDDIFDDFANRLVGAVVRTEIPLLAEFGAVGFSQLPAEMKVGSEGLENMLPRASGIRIANFNGLILTQGSDAIGNETISRPIATANDVARARARRPNPPRLRKKGGPIRGKDDLRATFRSAVRITTTEDVGFPIAPLPIDISVAFIGSYEDERPNAFDTAHGFADIHRASDIRIKSRLGVPIGLTNEGLGSEVKDDLGLCLSQRADETVEMAQIALDMTKF